MIYIRYAQVKECTSVFRSSASLPKWNHWALIFGLLSTAGLSIVANFQETSMIVVHLIGAFLCFGGGTAYFWTQVRTTRSPSSGETHQLLFLEYLSFEKNEAVTIDDGATIMIPLQAVCSFYLHPLGCSLRLAHLRTALSTFSTVCFFVIVITGVLARLAYKGWFVHLSLVSRVSVHQHSRNALQERILGNGTRRTAAGSCT